MRYMKPFLELLNGSLKSPVAFIERYLFELEHSNQAHMGALMFAKLIGIPFLKKDICRNGIYSISQVLELIEHLAIMNNVEQKSNYIGFAGSGEHGYCFNSRITKQGSVDQELFDEAASVYRTQGLGISYARSPSIINSEKGMIDPSYHLHLYVASRRWR